MQKKKWITKILYLSYILTTSAFLISCSKENMKREGGNADQGVLEESLSKVDEEATVINLEFGEDATLLPETSIVRVNNTYICYDISASTWKEYQDILVEQGYQLFLEENVGGYDYKHYTNEINRIQVVSAGNNVFISIVRNYQQTKMEERVLSNEEAMQLIKDSDKLVGYIKQDIEENTSNEAIDIIVKHWISDLYEKTNILAYSAYTKQGKDAGTYLIYDNKVYRIQDSLEKTCVADLNQDGTFELLSLHGFGFGIYRINLNVYQAENPIYFNSLNKVVLLKYSNCFVPKRGYGNLEFNKVSDTKVHLLEVEETNEIENNTDGQVQDEQVKYEQIKDYGALIIAEDNIHIVPESMEEFPYYQWDQDYIISQNDSQATNVKTMKQIPRLEVSFRDTTLKSVGSKIDWNGEKEDTIEFSELMEDKIPMFDQPNIVRSYTEEICLIFEGAAPTKIAVTDYLLTEDGEQQYDSIGAIERAVRFDQDGNYYVGLVQHIALSLSSNSDAYTNPSFRGFRVTCEFGDKQVCEYVFVLSVAPQWIEEH